MKRAIQWFIPHPLLTLILTITWVLLQNEVTLGMIVFGLILGILIPWGTSIWWPEQPKQFRPLRMIGYSLIVIRDIVVANIEVAWIVLTVPTAKLRPAWIVIPLRLRQPEAITMLAGTITLTPGTVSADLSDQGSCLLVHVLHTDDPEAVRAEIIDRYEARLLEIFK